MDARNIKWARGLGRGFGDIGLTNRHMRGFGFELPTEVEQHVVLIYADYEWVNLTQVCNQCLWLKVCLE